MALVGVLIGATISPESISSFPNKFWISERDYIADLYRLKNPAIDSIIKQTGLEEYQFKKIQILSKGYRQRKALKILFLQLDE